MTRRTRCWLAGLVVTLAMTSALHAQSGEALFKQLCSTCHEGANERAPRVEVLQQLAPEQVLNALQNGTMITMAAHRSASDHRAIAEYITGKKLGQPLVTTPTSAAMCADRTVPALWSNAAQGDALKANAWSGWGVSPDNSRFAGAEVAGLTAADVPKLKVKWAFAFPGDLTANAQPAVVGNRVFVGSAGGLFYSLSADSGCIHWFFKTAAAVRGAPSIGTITTATGPRYTVFVATELRISMRWMR